MPSQRGRVISFITRCIVGAVVLAAALLVYGLLERTAPKPALNEVHEPSRSVRIVTLRELPIARSWDGYGTARPRAAAEVEAEVAATVVEKPDAIEEGLPIEEGDLIARLDAEEFVELAAQARASIEAAEARLTALDVERESLQETLAQSDRGIELLESEAELMRRALEREGAKQIELDRILRELTAARREREEVNRRLNLIPSTRAELKALIARERAAARLAQVNLARCEIRSPIRGVLQWVDVNVGDRVAPGAPLARIVNLRRIEVPLRLPLSAAPELRVGDRAEVIGGSGAPADMEGVVARIAPEADPETRTVVVYAEFDQEVTAGQPPRIVPGQFIVARVTSGRVTDRVVVPRPAINSDRVMVVDTEGRAAPRDVTGLFTIEGDAPAVHPAERQWVVIADGVAAGERVIISNLDEIEPGMLVRYVDVATGERGGAAASPEAGPRASSINGSPETGATQ